MQQITESATEIKGAPGHASSRALTRFSETVAVGLCVRGDAQAEPGEIPPTDVAAWFADWAERHPDTAHALASELRDKPDGGFSVFIKRSRSDQEAPLSSASPTMSAEPQTRLPEPPDTSGSRAG